MLALLLVAWGNAKAWWDLVVLGTTAAGGPFGAAAGVALVVVLSAVARTLRLTWTELGLDPGQLQTAMRHGVKTGALIALTAALGLFAIGLIAGAELSPAARLTWPELALRCLLWLPLDTALPEEFAFRGVLLGVMLRTLGTAPPPARATTGVLQELRAVISGMPHPAVFLSSLAFMAWHVVVVQQDGPQPPLVIAAKLLGIFAGGLFFGSLRLRAGHLAAPFIAHWTFDAAAFTAARLLASL